MEIRYLFVLFHHILYQLDKHIQNFLGIATMFNQERTKIYSLDIYPFFDGLTIIWWNIMITDNLFWAKKVFFDQ